MRACCTSPQASASSTALFLLAHNDDEFFIRPKIIEEIHRKHRVVCIYTTDGAAYGELPERRLRESVAALRDVGVQADCIVPLGTELKVQDGLSHHEIRRLWDALLRVTSGQRISCIYTLAWDGGHVDHDTAHLLAVALGRIHGCPVKEFSAYHRHKAIGPLIRCMSLLSGPGSVTIDRVSVTDAVKWAASCRHYKSQRRTFLALLPFCLPQILGRRALETRLVPRDRNYLAKPHQGPLLYETRFKVPHQQFVEATQGFIQEVLGSSENTHRAEKL